MKMKYKKLPFLNVEGIRYFYRLEEGTAKEETHETFSGGVTDVASENRMGIVLFVYENRN